MRPTSRVTLLALFLSLVARTTPTLAQEILSAPVVATSSYNKNLATAEFGWGRVGDDQRLTPVAAGGLESKGPWFVDGNHWESGLLVGPAAIWTKGANRGIPGTPDLLHAKLRVNAEFQYQPVAGEANATDGGRLVFWFQSHLPKTRPGGPERIVNYAFNRDLLPDAIAGRMVHLTLTASLDDWTCLGRDQRDVRPYVGSAAKYTCALNSEEFKTALSAVNDDMGLLLLLPEKDRSGNVLRWVDPNKPRTEALKNSRLVLKEFTIVK